MQAAVVGSTNHYSSVTDFEEEISTYNLGDKVLLIADRLASKRADRRIFHADLVQKVQSCLSQDESNTLLSTHEAIRHCINYLHLFEVENSAVVCYTRRQPKHHSVYSTPQEDIEMRRHAASLDRENTRQEFKRIRIRSSSSKHKSEEQASK